MKPIRLLVLVALLLALVLTPVASAAASSTATRAASDRSPGAAVSQALTTVTGVAISPLLGTGALGAYQWVTAHDEATRERLPWYAQPKFWVPALLLVGICALKDASGVAVPPVLKKPLDALEVVENKFSALIAAGAVIPIATDALWNMLLRQSATLPHAHAWDGFALIPGPAMTWAPVLDVLTVPFALAVFAVVWMASHAITVLILLSPWGGIDAALKAARTALLGLLAVVATINPWLGALLSIVVIIVAWFVAGWAFRLTVFGSVLSWDFFTGRRGRFVPAENNNAMFSGAAFAGVPARTYGRLMRRPDGTLEFVFRRWLVLAPRAVPIAVAPAGLSVGRGLFLSTILSPAGLLFLLPPRYRGHEETLVQRYQFGGGVVAAGLRKAWGSLKDLVAGRPAPAVAVT